MLLRHIVRLYALAVVAASLLLSSGSARADITITGGTADQQAAIQHIYKSMPACCHKSACICVRILDSPAMDSYLQSCAASQSVKLVNAGAVDGLFQNATPTISLRNSDGLSATFTHEYGHYIWMNVLTGAQRDEYAKTYKAQRDAHRLVSAYAAVSVEEGFAEAFSFYNLQKLKLAARDNSSCCFLDECLKSSSQTP